MLRCHYEVVAVEAADFVSPESNCYTAPFGQNRGMMDLLFGQSDNAIGKASASAKFLKRKPRSSLWIPSRSNSAHSRICGLRSLTSASVTRGESVGSTGNTFFAIQFGHDQRS